MAELIGLSLLGGLVLFLLCSLKDGYYTPFIWIAVMAGYMVIVSHTGPWMAPVLGVVIILWVRGL